MKFSFIFQYAGTAALKGDVTRSGERKLTGIMKVFFFKYLLDTFNV